MRHSRAVQRDQQQRTEKKNAARDRRRGLGRHFIGIDGEGINNPDGSHDYVLLTYGQQSLHKGGERLGTLEIFEFLYDQFLDEPKATPVGFYLGYDFAQWLRDLPENRARMLISGPGQAARRRTMGDGHMPPFPVEWQGWEFDMLPPSRRFKLRPVGKGNAWLTICDCGPFFQSSFLAAINPAAWPRPICTPNEYRLIAEGKELRAGATFNDAMIRYNLLECDVLARLMALVNQGLCAEGIKLNRTQWFGPGQAAQKWLRNINAPTGEAIRKGTDPEFREAARRSYFGGWFEIFWHGIFPGRCWGYDINSAYPRIMSELPCLLHGRYSNGTGEPPQDLSGRALALVYGAARGSHPLIGAMLHRTEKGKILRPQETRGWFWLHEIEAGKVAGVIDSFRVEQWRVYEPCACAAPLAGIADLYKSRLAVGKNSPEGKGKKLVYNSAYGKFAQSVGDPVFGNPVYASLITAGCRTMILQAIGSHPAGADGVLMIATDGIVFREPHAALELDKARLGAWDESPHDNLSLYMPGVYWDDETRKRLATGDDPKLKSRGIAARDLASRIATLDRAWHRFQRDGWPRLVLPIGFQMVSPRQALARNNWALCGSISTKAIRLISANPKAKRAGRGPGDPRSGFGGSLPYKRAENGLNSVAYDKVFGEELAIELMETFGDHPDGDPRKLIYEAFYG